MLAVPNPGRSPQHRAVVREELLLGTVFVAALVLRGLHAWGQAAHNPFFYAPTMDEGMHDAWARQIASGAGLGAVPFFRAPLYYYLLAAIYKLVGPNIVLARVVGCCVGSVTCYLIARFGVALGGLRVGLIAGLIAAVYWPLIYFDGQLLTVWLELFLNVAMLMLLWHAERRADWRLFLLGGVAFGLSAITRPTVLALAPGILLWLWVMRPMRTSGALRPTRGSAATTRARMPVLHDAVRREPRPPRVGGRPIMRAAGLIFAGAAIAILPVTIRNRVVGGEWVLIASYGGVNFYIGNNPQADGVAAIVPGTRADWLGGYEDTHRIPEAELGRKLSEGEVSSYWFDKGLAWIRANPAAWLRLTWHKFRLFWSPVEIPNNQPDWYFARLSGVSVVYWIGFPVVACLGLAGLVLIGRDGRTWSLPLLFALINMLAVVAFFCPGRYRLPVVPVLILLSAAGLARVPELWRAGARRTLGAYALVALLASVFLATNPPDRAVHWRETEGMAHHNLAVHYAQAAQSDPAARGQVIEQMQQAIQLRPNDATMHTALGMWLLKFGRPAEAAPALARALELDPNSPEAHGYYGDYLYAQGQLAEAVAQYEAAVALRPTWSGPRVSLGHVLAKLGRTEDACTQLEAALRIDPELVDARQQLGMLLMQQGQFAAARAQLAEVVQRKPNGPAAAQLLATALWKDGAAAEAVRVLRDAVQRTPDDERILKALAWMLATAPDAELRNGAEAVQLAERALQVAGRPSTSLLNTLAAALAEAGQFDRAVEVCTQAIEGARAAGQGETVAELETRLALYRAGKAYRESN